MRHQRAFTLLELLIAIAVLGILSSIGVVSYKSLNEHTRLRGATEELYSLMHVAKSEAIKRNEFVAISSKGSGTSWCVGVHAASTSLASVDCDCTLAAGAAKACNVAGVRYVMSSADFDGVTLASFTNSGEIVFEPTRGLARTKTGGAAGGATAKFTNANNGGLEVIVSALGRVRVCSTSGKDAVGKYPTC